MNLPNKITIGRIFLSVLMIVLLLIPWYDLNFQFKEYLINGEVLSLKYVIAGIIFVIAYTFVDIINIFFKKQISDH